MKLSDTKTNRSSDCVIIFYRFHDVTVTLCFFKHTFLLHLYLPSVPPMGGSTSAAPARWDAGRGERGSCDGDGATSSCWLSFSFSLSVSLPSCASSPPPPVLFFNCALGSKSSKLHLMPVLRIYITSYTVIEWLYVNLQWGLLDLWDPSESWGEGNRLPSVLASPPQSLILLAWRKYHFHLNGVKGQSMKVIISQGIIKDKYLVKVCLSAWFYPCRLDHIIVCWTNLWNHGYSSLCFLSEPLGGSVLDDSDSASSRELPWISVRWCRGEWWNSERRKRKR